MANTRSGGANNEGAGGTSARKGSAATSAKDPKSATTSTSSASGRESRSLSTRETSDEQKPNLRRSNRETKGKNPILTTSSASTPVPQKSIRGRSNPSTPGTPKSSARKLKGSMRKASTPRTSDRVKKSTVSASTASNDATGVSSPVATPDKAVKREIDEHDSTKNDASESGTMPLKKQKRLTAQSYTNIFKTSSEEYEKSPAYEGNASKVHTEDNGSVLRYEESGAHEEDNQAHLSQVANNFLEGYTSGLCEVPKVILETDGLKTDVEKSEEDKQAYSSQVVNKFWEGYTSGQCEAPKVILETDGLKNDVEKSAPISEDLVTLSSPVQAHMTVDLCSSSPAMDATEPTDDCSEFALHVAMGQKADSSKFVEYWVPARLSRVQLEMYCYTLLSNSPALRSHSKTDSVGALRNILVSLRKCCDHPYLVDKTLHLLLTKGHPVTDILDIGVSASGKLLLLDKMLQEIWKKGQRVLILSQSCGGAGNPMGDILDDFVNQRFGFESYERVERDLNVRKKQGAMSMFNDTTKGRFIFLIDSRACVPSIKLSSVDVIIIYCSDWNPTNDLRVLQKISIESQSECVPIFRLYSSCTVEEKALILAKHGHILDSTVQNIRPILSHSLLSWGASFLFSRLEGLKNYACLRKDSDAEKLFMDKVLLDLKKLSTKDDPSTKMSNAAISQAHLSGPFYSRDSLVVGEREGISAPDSDLPKFWVNLLDQKSPRWQYITEQAQRSCRKIQNMEEGNVPADEADEGSTKRRKIAGILDSSANVLAGEDQDSILPETNTACSSRRKIAGILDSSANVLAGEDKDSILPETNVTSSSHQISVDDTWQEQGVENLQDTQKSLHIQLKPEISKLYELFELPGSVKCLCEELLEYTLKNHQVSQVPKDILHAFNIALCWRAASLSRHKVDHRESLALAVEHLKYECSETLAEKVYKKLRVLKKEFSHRVGRTSKSNQSISVKNISPYQQETSTKYGCDKSIPKQAGDKSIPKQAASVGGNESHQEDSHDLVIEPIVPGEKEVLYVPEIHEKQHLSKDALLNRITEKRIKLVDMVFSLREKNIHDKQTNEVAMFDIHRHKGVEKLREACRIVVEHLRRSQAAPEDRGSQRKLIVEWFTMLLYAFLKHMRYQREKLDLQQSMVWTKELQLKENFLHEAKFGQLDLTFDEHIYLPDSGFAIEEFSHFSSCVDTATSANCLQSLHETSAMEVTLVRSVIPSDVINAEAARNGSAEVLIHNGGMPASEGIGLTENTISNIFDCIDSQGGASLAVQHQVNSSPAIDNSINQESSSGDDRRTEHVGRQSGVGSQPLPGETDQHLGDAEMEVNTGNGDNTQADPPYLEPQIVVPVPSQASLQMSNEVEAEANLLLQSGQPIAAPAQLLQREAEQVDRSGMIPAQTLQPEMQPSASREAYMQSDLIIQSAQPSMVPTELSQRNVEQASLYRVPSSQCLPSGMHPWVPLSSILLERTHSDQCQPSHQPEAALGSSAKMVASMVFNHPPVGDEPLKNELHRLRSYIDSLNKTNELKKSQLRTECSQEIDKVKQKYDLLLQEQDSTHLQQTRTLDNLCEKVLLNQSIADYFRAKFISSSGAQARAHSPPNHQTPQASQQVPPRPSAVASTASPAASSSAGRPLVLTHHIQPLQVDRPSPSSPADPPPHVQPLKVDRPSPSSPAGPPPHVQPLKVDQLSPSSSPSSQVVRPRPSILNNIVRSPSTTFSLAPVLPRGSFGVQSDLARARAPAPHLRRRLPPQVHSMASANQQQLPTKLESISARTRATPVTPVNIRQSCPQAVPPGNPSLSSLHPSLYPTLAALLGPSSSHQIQQVPLLPSSSQPTRLSSPVPSTPNPVLPLTSPRGLTMTSSVSSAASNVLPSRGVGPSASGTLQSDPDPARWMNG
ncbi:helicase protein MOM1-like isoform X1 [Triticum dicoccoides]|uniref:helicase protein MOM1-like isoform X1 n=1 Tax=Triticum dicoccoides TaxID=85692 RepID=UPI000E7963DD|nr:helicase protein MOM1-like isoform X1 [Triticum dicoccoides]